MVDWKATEKVDRPLPAEDGSTLMDVESSGLVKWMMALGGTGFLMIVAGALLSKWAEGASARGDMSDIVGATSLASDLFIFGVPIFAFSLMIIMYVVMKRIGFRF